MKKRLVALLLCAVMILSLSACGGTASTPSGSTSTSSASSGNTPSGDTAAAPVADADNPWAGIVDTSKQVTMNVYAFGTAPNDLQEVVDLINERMVELINTKIEVDFVSLSDWPTKYPLLLTGGDSIDLVYAGEWTGYADNAKKGAFVELTDEFIETYMPQTHERQAPASWAQASIGGKIYAVPRNYTENQSYGAVIIRKDIREKYDIPEVTDFASYENYLFTVAEKDNEGYGLYIFPSYPLWYHFLEPQNNLYDVSGWVVWCADDEPDADNLQYLFKTDAYHQYVLQMAEWARRGVWPSSAINSTTHINDQFEQGRSYSVGARLQEAQDFMDHCEAATGGECEYIDIIPSDHYTKYSNYSGDMIAISSFSQDPERAAVVLDILKTDKIINDLCQGGIEGRHYIRNADGSRSNGPEAEDYPYSGWAWGLREKEYYLNPASDPRIKPVEDSYAEKLMPADLWIFDGFTTDDSLYKAEIAVINSVVSEYQYSFDCGVFGDQTEAKYQEFMQKLDEAGLQKVMEEWIRQAKEFTGT